MSIGYYNIYLFSNKAVYAMVNNKMKTTNRRDEFSVLKKADTFK
jgi:hypothetical protein